MPARSFRPGSVQRSLGVEDGSDDIGDAAHDAGLVQAELTAIGIDRRMSARAERGIGDIRAALAFGAEACVLEGEACSRHGSRRRRYRPGRRRPWRKARAAVSATAVWTRSGIWQVPQCLTRTAKPSTRTPLLGDSCSTWRGDDDEGGATADGPHNLEQP
jgi:hypothetical protein